jgi:hypothetical protein
MTRNDGSDADAVGPFGLPVRTDVPEAADVAASPHT